MLTTRTLFSCLLITLLGSVTTGCAHRCAKHAVDPYEKFNRAVFSFNQTLDKVIFHPVADLYETVTPPPVYHGLGNVYSNLHEPARAVNEILQLEFKDAISDTGRFALNSTFGLFGLIDVASGIGLPKHQQDLGLTLARWGIRQSPYLVVPIFGPFTVRDAIAYPINSYFFTPWRFIEPVRLRNTLYAMEKIHYRALLLPADPVIRDAFDPYVFVRDAYLQKRNAMIREVVEEHHSPKDLDEDYESEA